MKKNWLIPIGLTVQGYSLAGQACGAVTYTRDGGPMDFGAAELDDALRERTAPARGANLDHLNILP